MPKTLALGLMSGPRRSLGHQDSMERLLGERLGGSLAPTPRGRDAIVTALIEAGVPFGGHVCVLTTSGSTCVSPCVRWALGRWTWGRRPVADTRAMLLIHEWGIPHPRSAAIAAACRDRGWALIEDCAHALGTALWSGGAGLQGDWAIYSLPKFSGLPSGGLLRGPRGWEGSPLPSAWEPTLRWLVTERETLALARRQVWQQIDVVAGQYERGPMISLPEGAVPWKYPLRVRRLHALARHLATTGCPIETCSHVPAALLPCDPEIAHEPAHLDAALRLCEAEQALPPRWQSTEDEPWC